MGRFSFAEKSKPAGNFADGLPEGNHKVQIVSMKEGKHPQYPTSLKIFGTCIVLETDNSSVEVGSESQFNVPLGQAENIVAPLLTSLAAAVLGVDANDTKAIEAEVNGHVSETIEAGLEQQAFKDSVIMVHAKSKTPQNAAGKPYFAYTFSRVAPGA